MLMISVQILVAGSWNFAEQVNPADCQSWLRPFGNTLILNRSAARPQTKIRKSLFRRE